MSLVTERRQSQRVAIFIDQRRADTDAQASELLLSRQRSRRVARSLEPSSRPQGPPAPPEWLPSLRFARAPAQIPGRPLAVRAACARSPSETPALTSRREAQRGALP